MSTEDTPGNVPLSEWLGLEPERAEFMRWWDSDPGRARFHAGEVHFMGWGAAKAAERERCAAWVDCRRLEFCFQHATHDPHTGALEFGRGPHAEAKADYVGELEEIAEGLRALGPNV